MAKRFYCVQWCHKKEGWKDLPMLASTKEKEANDNAKEFAEKNNVQTRTIRKPHGWEPEDVNEAEIEVDKK